MGASLAKPFPLCHYAKHLWHLGQIPLLQLRSFAHSSDQKFPPGRIASADTRSNRFCGGFLGPKLPHTRLLHLRNRELQYPTGKKKSKAKPSLANLTQLLVPGFVSRLTPSPAPQRVGYARLVLSEHLAPELGIAPDLRTGTTY